MSSQGTFVSGGVDIQLLGGLIAHFLVAIWPTGRVSAPPGIFLWMISHPTLDYSLWIVQILLIAGRGNFGERFPLRVLPPSKQNVASKGAFPGRFDKLHKANT